MQVAAMQDLESLLSTSEERGHGVLGRIFFCRGIVRGLGVGAAYAKKQHHWYFAVAFYDAAAVMRSLHGFGCGSAFLGSMRNCSTDWGRWAESLLNASALWQGLRLRSGSCPALQFLSCFWSESPCSGSLRIDPRTLESFTPKIFEG